MEFLQWCYLPSAVKVALPKAAVLWWGCRIVPESWDTLALSVSLIAIVTVQKVILHSDIGAKMLKHPDTHTNRNTSLYSQWGQIFRLGEEIFRFRNNPKSYGVWYIEKKNSGLSNGDSRFEKHGYILYIMWWGHWFAVGVKDATSLKTYFGSQWNCWNNWK